MRIQLLAASAALFASTLAFADDTKPVAPAATDDPNSKVTCQPVTHEGQLVGKTCHTQNEWDHIRFEEQQRLRQYQQQSLFQHPM